MPDTVKKVPARYVGGHSVKLSPAGGPYTDASGARLESLILNPGDTLHIAPHEVYGQTRLWDPSNNLPPYDLGFGHVVLAQHAGKSDAELAALGYEFTQPRPDFEALQPVSEYLAGQGIPEAGKPREAIVATEDGGLTIADLRQFVLKPEEEAALRAAQEAAAAQAAEQSAEASATPDPTLPDADASDATTSDASDHPSDAQ